MGSIPEFSNAMFAFCQMSCEAMSLAVVLNLTPVNLCSDWSLYGVVLVRQGMNIDSRAKSLNLKVASREQKATICKNNPGIFIMIYWNNFDPT